MKRLKKWLAAAGLLLCLMAGAVSVYAEPEETKTESTNAESADQQESSDDRNSRKEKDQEKKETLVPTETPEPTETPVPTEEAVPSETATPTETPVPAEAADAQGSSIPVETAIEEPAAESTSKELPKGNLTLAEDIVSKKNGNREFLTVYSREGDYFYIIIDRDAAGTGNVFFLNMVDDQDLYTLSGDAIPDRSAANAGTEGSSTGDKNNGSVSNICTCVDRCTDGDIDPSCQVCKEDPGKCKGIKTVSDSSGTDDENSNTVQKKPELNLPVLVSGATALILLILFYFLKIRKKEKSSSMPEYNIEDYLTDEGDDENGTDD